MSQQFFRNEQARLCLEEWYLRFMDRVDVHVTRCEVSTSLGPNHVLLAGDESHPLLVCLHPMMASSAHLLSELGPLRQRFRIIAPDLPGQSVRGIPVRLPLDDNSYAEWLLEVFDGLNLEAAYLFGISWGGFVARQFASFNPEKVKKLALMVPAGIVKGPVFKGLAGMAVPMIMYRIRRSEYWLRKLVNPLLSTWDEDWARYLGDVFTGVVPDLRIPPLATDEELAALSMPTLVIAAEKDISFPGQPLIERVRTHIPQVETELVSDSRHCPPTTDEFRLWMANRVTKFLMSGAKGS